MTDPIPYNSDPVIMPDAYERVRAFRKACSTGDLPEVARLSVAGCFPDWNYYLGEGLVAAILRKQLDVIRYLLDHGAKLDDGVAAAMAVKIESLPVFRILVEYGWDVNAPLMAGATALQGVIQNEELAHWLLTQGANPNLGPPANPQPHVASIVDSGAILGTAAALSSPAFFDILIQYGAKLENTIPLHTAAARHSAGGEKDRIPMMEHLLQLGVDINGSDESFAGLRAVGTPLHAAIEYGAMEYVRFLLIKGADPHKKCRSGIPALALAKSTRRQDVIDLIETFMRDQERS